MKTIARALGASLLVLSAAMQASAADKAKTAANDRVSRGKYLVTISGCHDCHTPMKMGPSGPVLDMSRMLSGHPESVKLPPPPAASGPWMASFFPNTAWAGPWGISYTANLTPDKVTGLGVPNLWTEELFIKAIRTGKHLGTSRPIMPPMPWENFAQMTDEDLKSIWAFLKTIPPVKNQVPEYAPPPAPPATAEKK